MTGLGLTPVARLLFEADVNLLGPSSDCGDLYNALHQAAVNLGWNSTSRTSLTNACLAVESNPGEIYVDKYNTCLSPNGRRTCVLNIGGPLLTVTAGVNAARRNLEDHLFIRTGTYNETMTIDKSIELFSYDGQVTIER